MTTQKKGAAHAAPFLSALPIQEDGGDCSFLVAVALAVGARANQTTDAGTSDTGE